MNNPYFSIIIPIYNSKQYLRTCLDSVINQSFNSYELLLIDDGSTDGSGEICDDYLDGNTNVKVFHVKNGGVSKARNIGLKNAQGKYVIFLDSDDFLMDNQVLNDIHCINRRHPNDVLKMQVCFDLTESRGLTEQIYPDVKIKLVEKQDLICSYIHSGFCFEFVYPSKLLMDYRFNESVHMGEDILLLSEILSKLDKLVVCDRITHNRVIRKGSLVHSEMKEDFFRNLDLIHQMIENNVRGVKGGDKVIQAIRADQTIAINMLNDCYKTQKEKIREIRKRVSGQFPFVLTNPFLNWRTKTLLTIFAVSPELYYRMHMIKSATCLAVL